MNGNLDNIFSKAANSNLTATALEFVPRSLTRSDSQLAGSSGSQNARYDRNDGREQRSRYDDRQERYDRRDAHYDRRNLYFDRYGTNYEYQRLQQHEKQRSTGKVREGYRNVGGNDYPDGRDYGHHLNQIQQSEKPKYQHRARESYHNNGIVANHSQSYFDESCSPDYLEQKRTRSTQKKNNRPIHVHDSRSTNVEKLAQEDRFYAKNKTESHAKNKTESRGSTVTKNSSVKNVSICQRDRLIEQLNRGVHECLICCETIKQREPVWNCVNCYYVLHMWCVIKWARSSTTEANSWRCPACQNEYEKVPEKYMCFCGKSKLLTEWNRSDTAHSCGEVCGRNRENPTPWFVCEHPCTLLCHPGPCPLCTIQVKRECGCGRTQQSVQCGTKTEVLCGSICDRLLNCGLHHCTRPCHFGECAKCQTKINIGCHCGKKCVERTCGVDDTLKFSCEQKCGRTLGCGNHICEAICHEGECGLCPRDPIVLNTCACGKMPVAENARQSCTDEVPKCDQVCGKLLKCGPPNRRHTCEKKCHESECDQCAKQTVMKCRCGALEKTVPCAKIDSKEADFRCQKKCAKKRSCGKHKCNQMCCIDEEHICSQRCNNSLNCGKHRCELLCHRGKCGRCLQSSFEELYCHCGHSVIYPPVACGTKPPACDQPCHRQHDCEHPPLHSCHSDRTCPPCTVFTNKLCYGGHELRKTLPCYQKEFSCGLPCGAPLPCGVHKCQVPCHAGDCLSLNKKCVQPCTKSRDLCGHRCAAPCHPGICPDTPCKEMVTVTCACGNIVAQHPCYEHTDDYRRIVAATLSNKMSELQTNNSVNIGDVNEKITAQMVNLRTLECTDECKFIMRNRRLALALQIQNPDLSAKLTPKYSDFMKSWVKKDPNLCRHVHDKLTALVKLAKESKQKSRSFSFEIMNKEKRQFVHEYCAHFGCESEAYDAEPKRNVVAIAVKGRCWLPSYSLLEVVQRDMGQRKVPGPVINKKSNSRDDTSSGSLPTKIILPVLPSAGSSQTGITKAVTMSDIINDRTSMIQSLLQEMEIRERYRSHDSLGFKIC